MAREYIFKTKIVKSENSVDLDEAADHEPTHLDLCFDPIVFEI